MEKNIAIETLKSFVENTDNVIAKDAILTLHPELKESEDEGIRKEINNLYFEIDTCISELLKARANKDTEAEGKALFKMEGLLVATLQDLSCIEDYLERQKTKEHYDRMAPIYENKESFESALDKAWKFYDESGSSTVDGCEDNSFELAFSKGFREGFLYREKQKELFKSGRGLYYYDGEKTTYCGYPATEENPKSADSIKSNCVSDAKRTNRILTNAIVALANSVDYNRSEPLIYSKEIDDLKRLREEIEKQKPAEWSEEDKRKLNRIYEILGYAADDKGFLTSKRIIGDKEAIELQGFLKSLRLSWKPSKEQMKFLLRLEGELRADNHPVAAKTLAEIYEQLKKLI